MRTISEYDKLRIPVYALSYLVNADSSGLSDEDEKAIDDYMDQFYDEARKVKGHVIFSPSDDEPYFTWKPEFGLASDVVDCTILIVK